jgi:hypothetical protein
MFAIENGLFSYIENDFPMFVPKSGVHFPSED